MGILNPLSTYTITLTPAGVGRPDSTSCTLEIRDEFGTVYSLPNISGATNTVGYWKIPRSFTGQELLDGATGDIEEDIDAFRFNVAAGGGCTQVVTGFFILEQEGS